MPHGLNSGAVPGAIHGVHPQGEFFSIGPRHALSGWPFLKPVSISESGAMVCLPGIQV